MIALSAIKSLMWSALSTNIGRGILIGLALFSAWQVDRYWQRSKGASQAVAEIERGQTDAIRNANKAGSASRDPAARGVRDPYTRTDN